MTNQVSIRERAVGAGLMLSMLGSVGFMVAYAKQAGTQWEGLALCAAFGGLLIAALGWARWILPHEQIVDLRDTYPQPEEEREQMVEAYEHGTAELTRRRWLVRLLYGAAGVLGLAALFPVGSLGPEPDDALFHTRWRRGVRLQRADGGLVKQDDVNVDGVITVFPEGSIGDSQSMTVLIRLPDGVGQNTVDGLIAYSKMCTHAGCPVALYRAADQRLICPCHQSAFDAANNAQVIDGPADHALPRLPLQISPDGFVQAAGDFPSPVGPGFWEER